ncbi:diguanylate cyclase [Massilia sp. BSC265]|uniref:GGDEF domain-containing protein n=1 Tax=Massilia sp. BSC265 TaxID=1549812 RepID=UPI0013773B39|nr:GGDEF domain-containing protein [Massilia sp. BSC265]
MDLLLEREQPSTLPLQQRAEADLTHFLPRLGPVLAILLVVYSVWDLSLDPAHALQSGTTRVVFAGLAAFAFWPIIPNWSAHHRAAWAHWMLSGGVILASAQLDGGLVHGIGGIIIGLFLVPFIANGTANFVLVITPPALLFLLCMAMRCTLPEFVRGALLYGSAAAVAFVQMRIALLLRHQAMSVEAKLIWDATHDPLTNLHNRAWLMQEAARAFSTARRYRTNLAFAMLDIDHFKRVNDTYGHQTGDQVLKAVAQAVQDSLRETDRCGRLGGEEFFCIFPHASQEAAWQCAERIRQAVAAAEVAEGDATVQVTISIGLAHMSDVHLGWEDLLKRADEALYKAKAAGRNCIMAL